MIDVGNGTEESEDSPELKERKPTDFNVTGKDDGAFAADLGIAHEYIVVGLLIRLGFEVGTIDLTRTPFDIYIEGLQTPKGEQISLRTQVKTITNNRSIKLAAGTRSGADREYKSDVKEYKYTTGHNDLIIGIDRHTFDLYLLPTRFTEEWGKSKAISKLIPLKNNWDILLNWNDDFLSALEKTLDA